MRIKNVQTYAFAALAVGAVIAGCAADDDEPAGTPAPSPTTTSTTAAERPPEPATCSNVTRSGGPVTYTVINAGGPPDALGGAITPGNYELTEVVVYDPTRGPSRNEDDPNEAPFVPDSRVAQKNIVMAKDHLRVATGDGTLADPGFAHETISASWYTIDGTNLTLSGICPTRTNVSIPYSATPFALVLFPEPGVAEFYSIR